MVVKPKRRQHSAEYKLRLLRELDECAGKGEVGAILRREGLYSSLISKWREQREQGSLNGLSGQRRGPKVDPNAAELARLQRENKRLAEALSKRIGKRKACAVLGIPRSPLYRTEDPRSAVRTSPRALSQPEREAVRQELNSERFQDCAPREVYASLLDEGRYLCFWRSMYRILDEHQEVRERRNQLRHPSYSKPELLATAPNQLWSWDITKLLGPTKWTYY